MTSRDRHIAIFFKFCHALLYFTTRTSTPAPLIPFFSCHVMSCRTLPYRNNRRASARDGDVLHSLRPLEIWKCHGPLHKHRHGHGTKFGLHAFICIHTCICVCLYVSVCVCIYVCWYVYIRTYCSWPCWRTEDIWIVLIIPLLHALYPTPPHHITLSSYQHTQCNNRKTDCVSHHDLTHVLKVPISGL